jgi:hypothetical protein
MVINRQKELDSLHLAVARALEPMGEISLATPYKSLRRVTVVHPSGASVRVIVSGQHRVNLYVISVLEITDDHNQKLTYSPNHTFRGLRAQDPDLAPIVARVKATLEALAQLPRPP